MNARTKLVIPPLLAAIVPLLAAIVSGSLPAIADEASKMLIPDTLELRLRQDAVNELVKGNLIPWSRQCSHRRSIRTPSL
jgi:hypothetical protein